MNSRGDIVTHTCTCGHTHRISEREIAMYAGLVQALWKVFRWCQEKGVHEFKTKDVRHLMTAIGSYQRFGDWLLFGGLVYRPTVMTKAGKERVHKGAYGINLERCDAFFAGKYEIPLRVWKNPITKAIRPEDYATIHQIPNLFELLGSDGEYIANYREQATVEI